MAAHPSYGLRRARRAAPTGSAGARSRRSRWPRSRAAARTWRRRPARSIRAQVAQHLRGHPDRNRRRPLARDAADADGTDQPRDGARLDPVARETRTKAGRLGLRAINPAQEKSRAARWQRTARSPAVAVREHQKARAGSARPRRVHRIDVGKYPCPVGQFPPETARRGNRSGEPQRQVDQDARQRLSDMAGAV